MNLSVLNKNKEIWERDGLGRKYELSFGPAEFQMLLEHSQVEMSNKQLVMCETLVHERNEGWI